MGRLPKLLKIGANRKRMEKIKMAESNRGLAHMGQQR